MAEKKKSVRTRNWSFIVYPESAPKDWIEQIKKEMIPFAVSPLHDEDINEGTGEVKKAHYHVLLCYEGVKTFEQIKTITERLNAPIPQAVSSAKGLIRYFVHRDNPEKAQYDISNIYSYGDIDIVSPFQTAISRYEAIKEMLTYVNDNNIIEFQDLMLYAMSEREDWFRYLCDSCAYIVQEFIKSVRHRKG